MLAHFNGAEADRVVWDILYIYYWFSRYCVQFKVMKASKGCRRLEDFSALREGIKNVLKFYYFHDMSFQRRLS